MDGERSLPVSRPAQLRDAGGEGVNRLGPGRRRSLIDTHVTGLGIHGEKNGGPWFKDRGPGVPIDRRCIMKFVVKKATNGEFRFNLVASNGQVVATSESYKQKASAMSTIASIQTNAGGASVDDQTEA